MPSSFSRSKTTDFGFVVNKVGKALQGWKRSMFSVPGKEILIKSVGLVIPSYIMSVFKLPKRLYEEITRFFSQFWWGSLEEKRKLHWCNWEKMSMPKSLGGLNFRDVEGFNKALIAKQSVEDTYEAQFLSNQFSKKYIF